MEISPFVLDWLSVAFRWLHVIAAMAWIGLSFYFIALDASLRKHPSQADNTTGCVWQIYGGSFYEIEKYGAAPGLVPNELTWFKWEAYATFGSGFALLAVVYYANADLYMLDPFKLDIGNWGAAAIGVFVLFGGTGIYDVYCKLPIVRHQWLLAILAVVIFPLVCCLLGLIMTGRGAFMHTGALMASIMVANVAHTIVPNQRKIIRAINAGETPDPELARQASLRLIHNNYLTLPVIFVMVSFHYPQIFANSFNWLILALVIIAGASIRYFFDEWHAGRRKWWAWGAAAAAAITVFWLGQHSGDGKTSNTAAEQTAAVDDIIFGRCQMCHSINPDWEGITTPPKNVVFDDRAHIERYAHAIYTQAVMTNAMPPGNLTDMAAEERHAIAAWYYSR